MLTTSPLMAVPTGYFRLDCSHGLGCLLLEAQRDLFFFLVDVEDHDLDFLVDLDHVAGDG